MGPTLIAQPSSSLMFLSALLTGKLPEIYDVLFPLVDVRDVAQAHINALLKEDLTEKRIGINQQTSGMIEFSEILSKNFKDFPVTTTVSDTCGNPRFARAHK